MLALNPADRITAEAALRHDFFSRAPTPTPPEKLPQPKSRSDDPLKRAPSPPHLTASKQQVLHAKEAAKKTLNAGDGSSAHANSRIAAVPLSRREENGVEVVGKLAQDAGPADAAILCSVQQEVIESDRSQPLEMQLAQRLDEHAQHVRCTGDNGGSGTNGEAGKGGERSDGVHPPPPPPPSTCVTAWSIPRVQDAVE
jgi:serine/threonine protein kinase